MVDAELEYYMPCGVRLTRSEQVYLLTLSMLNNCLLTGVPCTIVLTADSSVLFLNSRTRLAVGTSQPDICLTFLLSWGGSWMWSNISNEGIDFK